MLGVPIGLVLAQLRDEVVAQGLGDVVGAVVVVAVAGELALHPEVRHQPALVEEGRHARILDRREGVRRDREPGHAKGHVAVHVRVVQGHLDLLVGVLVVHVVDDVHGVDVQVRDPGDIAVKARLDLRVVERAAADDGLLRADLVAALLVAAAVERQQQELCEVAPRPEELHLLADARRGDAAGDGVVVAKAGAH